MLWHVEPQCHISVQLKLHSVFRCLTIKVGASPWDLGQSPNPNCELFNGFLQKFDMLNHVLGGQHIMDQHEASQHLRYRRLLRRVYNASMGNPGCMQPKKVRILRDYNAALLSRSLQVVSILSRL
jgi:hypothetical protein